MKKITVYGFIPSNKLSMQDLIDSPDEYALITCDDGATDIKPIGGMSVEQFVSTLDIPSAVILKKESAVVYDEPEELNDTMTYIGADGVIHSIVVSGAEEDDI